MTDTESLNEPGEREITLVLTQVSSAQALAAACAMAKTDVAAFDTPNGAVAIVGGRGEHHSTATTISTLLRDIPVLVMRSTNGQITAHTWEHGNQNSPVSPALALADSPDVIEHLLTGRVDPNELEGTTSSSRMSRWRAMRILANARKVVRR